jgi:hypothetical protein
LAIECFALHFGLNSQAPRFVLVFDLPLKRRLEPLLRAATSGLYVSVQNNSVNLAGIFKPSPATSGRPVVLSGAYAETHDSKIACDSNPTY